MCVCVCVSVYVYLCVSLCVQRVLHINQNSGRKKLVYHSNVVIQENVVKSLFPKLEGKKKLRGARNLI